MDIYYDRINGVLKNKLNIQDNKELDTVEYILTAYRLAQLGERDIKRALTMDDYKEIHRHIFQDIYEWAGEYRKVNLQKDKTNFLPFTFLNNAEKELNKSISSYLYSASDSKLFVCKKLGKILCDLNYMHPFREGNGRAQREFIRQLAYLK